MSRPMLVPLALRRGLPSPMATSPAYPRLVDVSGSDPSSGSAEGDSEALHG